ncbi:MAG: hypothetical protein R3C02_21370 [Planctomycetaceae bacterium]
MSGRIPIIILGGSDSRPGPVPEDVEHSRMLRGFKGAIALPNGRCLAQELVERIRGTDRFQDPVIVGPRRVYDGILDCRIVDVEGNLAETLRAVRTEVLSYPDLSQPVAFIACDILPTTDDFQQLLETCYSPNSQCSLWGQLVAVESIDMGASAWKPAYQFLPSEGHSPRTMYPGHLVIARPAALRIRLMNHLLQLAYRHRNVRLLRRPIPMFFKGMGQLIAEDSRNLLRGQLPVLSVSIPWHCLSAFLRFHQGRLSVPEFSRHVMKVFLHRDVHHMQPPAVVFSVTQLCAFAKDIDTTDELAEVSESVAVSSEI